MAEELPKSSKSPKSKTVLGIRHAHYKVEEIGMNWDRFKAEHAIDAAADMPSNVTFLLNVLLHNCGRSPVVRISADQIAKRQRLTRRTVLTAIQDAEDGGWIKVSRTSGEASVFDLSPLLAGGEKSSPVQNLHTPTREESSPPPVKNLHPPSEESSPPPVKKLHPPSSIKKEEKEKGTKARTPTHAPTRTHATREGQGGADAPISPLPPSNSAPPPKYTPPSPELLERVFAEMRACGLTDEYINAQRAKHRRPAQAVQEEEQ